MNHLKSVAEVKWPWKLATLLLGIAMPIAEAFIYRVRMEMQDHFVAIHLAAVLLIAKLILVKSNFCYIIRVNREKK